MSIDKYRVLDILLKHLPTILALIFALVTLISAKVFNWFDKIVKWFKREEIKKLNNLDKIFNNPEYFWELSLMRWLFVNKLKEFSLQDIERYKIQYIPKNLDKNDFFNNMKLRSELQTNIDTLGLFQLQRLIDLNLISKKHEKYSFEGLIWRTLKSIS